MTGETLEQAARRLALRWSSGVGWKDIAQALSEYAKTERAEAERALGALGELSVLKHRLMALIESEIQNHKPRVEQPRFCTCGLSWPCSNLATAEALLAEHAKAREEGR